MDDLLDRFAVKFAVDDGCWPWIAGKNGWGYGNFYTGGGRALARWRPAHILMYEIAVGPIPAGFEIDHTCHNEAAARGECGGGKTCPHRGCVNPEHLEAKTNGDNKRASPLSMVNRTHCPADHPYDEENTYIPPSGGRHCRICMRERDQAKRASRG